MQRIQAAEADSATRLDTLCASCQTGRVLYQRQLCANTNMQQTLTAAAEVLPDFQFDGWDFTVLGCLKLLGMFIHQREGSKCSELPLIKMVVRQGSSCRCQGLHVRVVVANAAAFV